MDRHKRRPKIKITPARVIAAGFAAAILIGAFVIPIVELVKAAQRLAARSRASETETA